MGNARTQEVLLELVADLTTAQSLVPRRYLSVEDWKERAPRGLTAFLPLMGEKVIVLDDLLAHPRVVILGEAGAGKTTELRRLAVRLAREAAEGVGQQDDRPIRIPVYCSLDQYFDGDPEAYIKACLEEPYRQLLDQTSVGSHPLILVFLLDGLDELPGSDPPLDERLGRLRALLQAPRLEQDRFVFSCRQAFYAHYQPIVDRLGLTAFHLLDLSDDEIKAVCEARGCPYEKLLAEAEALGSLDLLRNPLNLTASIEFREATGTLPLTRSGLFQEIIRRKLAQRPRAQRPHCRPALEVLAMTMELLHQNVLPIDEARRVLARTQGWTEARAAEILDELVRSTILVEVDRTLRFETPSLGEFLGAEHLMAYNLEEVQGFLLLPEENVLDPSWLNVARFLVELHDGFRHYACRNLPHCCLGAAPQVFSAEEQGLVFESLYRKLYEDAPMFLGGFEGVDAQDLAHHALPHHIEQLRGDLASLSHYRRGNAALLIGYLGNRQDIPALKALALNRNEVPPVRVRAIEAVSRLGSPQDAEDFVRNLPTETQLRDEYISAIAELVDEATLPWLLEVLPLRAGTFSYSVLKALERLRSESVILQILQFFANNVNMHNKAYSALYLKAVFTNMKRTWSDRIADQVVRLLQAMEKKRISFHDQDTAEALVQAVKANDQEGTIVQELLASTLEAQKDILYILPILGALLTKPVVEWLGTRPPGPIRQSLAIQLGHQVFHRDRSLYEALKPLSGGILEAQEAGGQQYRVKEKRRKRIEAEKIQRAQEALERGTDFADILKRLANITPSTWLPLPTGRREVLARLTTEYLRAIDPVAHVRWLDEQSFQYRYYRAAELTLKVINHYQLALEDDSILVNFLLISFSEPLGIIDRYFQRCGLSKRARNRVQEVFQVDDLHPIAASGFVHFLDRYPIPEVTDELKKFAQTERFSPYLRATALTILARTWDAEVAALLRQLTTDPAPEVARKARRLLIEHGDLGEIGRVVHQIKSGQLIVAQDDTAYDLEDAEAAWLRRVKAPRAFNLLQDLLTWAAERDHTGLTYTMVYTLGEIDRDRALRLLSELLRQTWPLRAQQIFRDAIERWERTRALERGRARGIDVVIERLRPVQQQRVIVIYCEGGTDLPFFKEFLRKYRESRLLPWGVQVACQPIGGWGVVKAREWEPRDYIAANRHSILILDGEERDPNTGNLSIEAAQVEEKCKRAGLPLFILERRSIENYFTPPALAAVYGWTLPTAFRVDPHAELNHQLQAIDPRFSHDKHSNGRIAETMSIADIEGTDLERVFLKVIEIAATITS